MARSLSIYLRLFVGIFVLSCWSAQTIRGQSSYSRQATISETGGKTRLVANDSRPLAQALDALQQKYGWRVNYEDPQYTSALDLIDAKGMREKSSYPNGQHRVPNGGAFVAELGAASTANALPDEKETLQRLIDSYNRSSNPGRFELREERPEQFFDVVGTSAHDNQGRMSKQQALLDWPITIDSQERTLSDTVDLVCQKLTEKGHITITFGVHPLGLDRVLVTVGGKDLTGRTFLSRIMASTNRKLCWRLLFDPDSNSYFLNLQLVRIQ